MAERPCELVGGVYDGRTGHLDFGDVPPARLMFSLADRDALSTLVLTTSVDDELTAIYVLIDEKPRKVITYDDNGRARSEKGVRYRYSKDSPIEKAFTRAESDALLTTEAHEQVMNTRRLLLDQAAKTRG